MKNTPITNKRGGKMEKQGGRAAAAEAKRKTFIADAIAKPPSQRTKRGARGNRAGNK
jgi:hypothetical protein